ncbi:MAG: polysaccharide pyruvyl transferase family protein [Kiritimatiellaeota bacterium]|nr:polysaccharide pyruvyl transferase family protein [Kiritimatiellota bacterium]
MKIFLDAFSKGPTVSIGTQAYIIAAAEVLERTFPGCEIQIFSADQEVDRWVFRNEKFNITMIPRPESAVKAMLALYRTAKHADVVVSLWGDGYISAPARMILRKTVFFRLARARSVLWPSSIGIEKTPVLRKLQRAGLSGFEVLMARDTITYDHFQALTLSPLLLVADMAFVLDPSNKERIAELYKQEKIPSDKKCIGLNISQLMNQFFIKEGMDYPAFAADLACFLKEEFDCNVLLIPHQIYPEWYKPKGVSASSTFGGDDRFAIKEVLKALDGAEGIYPVMGEYDPREFKGIISSCELMVGARMHSIIAALSTSVPAVLLGYSHKAKGVLNTLEMGDYVIEFTKEPGEIKTLVKKAWDNRAVLRASLDRQMPGYQEPALKVGEQLKTMLEK